MRRARVKYNQSSVSLDNHERMPLILLSSHLIHHPRRDFAGTRGNSAKGHSGFQWNVILSVADQVLRPLVQSCRRED